VPVLSTAYSLDEMGLEIKEGLRAWFLNQQVAGWVVTYEPELTFLTVRGAGHSVAVLAPEQSLAFFSDFLSGTPLQSA
jgi:hypothetical protein